MNITWVIRVDKEDDPISVIVENMQLAFNKAGSVRPQKIIVDCSGIGDALFEKLENLGLPVVAQ